MNLDFGSIIDFLAQNLFGGSTTLAGLAMLIAAWAICAIIFINAKASPAYSVVPMIPICIFFSAYGILDETISILVILVSGVMVASTLKRAVD